MVKLKRIKFEISILIFMIFLEPLSAQNNSMFGKCDYKLSIAAGKSITLRNPNYPGKYASGTNCRYIVQTVNYYAVQAVCQVKMDSTTQKFYVSRDGDYLLRFGEYFYNHYFTRTSVGQMISLAFTSQKDGKAGTFDCKLTSVYIKPCDCGWMQSTKIYNGWEANPNEFTPMVGIKSKATQIVLCGGAIIHYNYILSAAHCFPTHLKASQILAVVGDQDQFASGDTIYESSYGISQIIKHKSYDPNTDSNDIALLKTSKDIIFSRGVGPICLPFKYQSNPNYFDNYNVAIPGWGLLDFGGVAPRKLQKTYLTIMSKNTCTDSLKDPNKICTENRNTNKDTDTCQMDSGGSLYFWDGKRYYTVGIVSYGVACGSSEPSVNTRVTSYLTWIKQNTNYVLFCEI